MAALEDLLCQSLEIQRELAEGLIIVETIVKKSNEAEKRQRMDENILEAVLKTTNNSADAQESSPKNKEFVDENRRNHVLNNAVRFAVQKTVKNSSDVRGFRKLENG